MATSIIKKITPSDIGGVAKTGDTMTGTLTISNTTASTNSSTGALRVTGGAGIGGDVNIGGALSVGNAATTKGNLGLGTADMNFRVTNASTSNQGFMMTVVVQNSNYTSRFGHTVILIPRETGLSFYDNTDNESIWSFTLPLPVNRGGFGGTTAEEARDNLSVAAKISLLASDDTAASIYNKLSTIPVNETATIYIHTDIMKLLTGKSDSEIVTSYGTVFRYTTNDFRFMMARANGQNIHCFRCEINNSSIETKGVYRYTGTAI